MKTNATPRYLQAFIGALSICMTFTLVAQPSNIEIEDGNLIVNRVNATAKIEVKSSANQSAQIQFGDNGVASDGSLGWNFSTGAVHFSTGGSLDNFGIIMSGIGTNNRIGLGSLPDVNSKVMINHNSSNTSPILLLQENNNSDAARMQFGQFGVNDRWQLSALAAANPYFTFGWGGASPSSILTLDGDGGNVIVEDGKLEVKEATGTAVIEVSSGGAASDAQIEFGDNGSANDAVIGWESGSGQLRMTTGTNLGANGINITGSGTNTRIGLGTNPDANATVAIQSNSSAGVTPTPNLLIQENNNSDFARLQFGQFGVDEYWHVAVQSEEEGIGADPKFNIYYHDGVSGNNIVVIDGDDARVGIDRNPTSNAFEVNGEASKTTAGNWGANSDKRIKREIVEIKNSFETLLKLRPVKFKYTTEWMQRNPSIKDQYYYNYIAQEFQEVFPESVHGSGEYLVGDPEEILQVDTYNAQIVNIAATQELIRENQQMKEEIASLKNALLGMTSENQSIKADLQTIKAMLTNKTGQIAGLSED